MNAIVSVVQTSVIIHPKFYMRVDPKMMLYQFIIRSSEHDVAKSESLIGIRFFMFFFIVMIWIE